MDRIQSTGSPEPLGVALVEGGATVAVFSADAERIELCLFDESGAEALRIALPERTGDVHHGFVPGLVAGQSYGLRAHGPWRPEEGLRFNPAKLLVDPYARRVERPDGLTSAMEGHGVEGLDDLLLDPTDTAPIMPKCIIEAPAAGAVRPAVPRPAARIIYELHVAGFTKRHPKVPPALRGTMAGLAHPAAIEHLVGLGVTTVELMPLAAWLDERHLPPLGLSNYWGYNPYAFLAPDPRLAPGGMADVAAAVDALHAAGLEVVLDVVYNHSAESDQHGQTLSFRGLDNRTYYRLAEDRRYYVNDTGCGHTIAADRPPVMRLVMDALRHWAIEGGIDGFRFDLATTLARTEAGFDPGAPLLAAIGQDPVLRERLMVAEPWDIGYGGYRLGEFPAGWGEWNDKYRDDVRRFWRGDGTVGTLATRLAGSSDIFAARHRRPSSSVNFIAAHDGFTLADAVTFAEKHNEENGEDNRDGHDGEVSWAAGAGSGRDARALLATLMVSRGTPMLTMGDELGRSQKGNNNAYALDNETTWLDWDTADGALIAFVGRVCALRRDTPVLAEDRYLSGQTGPEGVPDVVWLAPHGGPMAGDDWHASRPIGMALTSGASRAVAWLNASQNSASIWLPEAGPARRWRRAILSDEVSAPAVNEATFAGFDRWDMPARSVAIFVEEAGGAGPRGGAVEPALLDRLAEMAGIAPDWWEVSGKHTIVSPDTKRALLAAMGLPATSLVEARDSYERLRALAVDTEPGADGARCHVPDTLSQGGRRWGVSAQLYTLRRAGDQAVGDFSTLRLIADDAAAEGAATIALNPLHALFPSDRERASPYQPSDRRYLDPIYIDLMAVPEIGAARAALADNAAALETLARGRLVDWSAVWRIKRAALAQCFEAAGRDTARRAALAAFRKAGGEALERFALFQALEEEVGGTAPLFPAAIGAASPERQRAVDFAVYLQALAEEQLAHAAGADLAIGLYRDLAVGAAPDGAEVWSAPDAFMRGVTVGAPPDPFSAAGQVWNIPPLDPMALQATDFAHFRALLRANMRHAGALRIDHAMALQRLFVIPQGAPASEGAYLAYPMEGMIRALAEESREARCLVIGEDLGTVPDGFRERVDAADTFSYRVLFFERDGEAFRPAASYPAKSVACVATHDLPTLKGWWSGADLALDRTLGRMLSADADALRVADRDALAAVIGAAPEALTPPVSAAVHGFLASSPAALVLAQVEDLAGEAEPVNVPGTEREYPNWRRRVETPAEQIFEAETAKDVVAAMRASGR